MISIVNLLRRIINIKFKYFNNAYGDAPFRLLDVGAGNHSSSKTKAAYPNCEYYGLDMDKTTSYSEQDFKVMKDFFELDLTKLNFDNIPDDYFDYINMAHVIEHLHNGDLVLPLLLKKLKSGGYFYIEYPGSKSVKLPSMYGTLNFHDDPTHVRVYSVSELKEIFEKNNCAVLRSGTRRNWYYILATPLRVIISLMQIGKIRANVFWDLLGFAEFLYVRKK
jgi:SAM-dependent methyltransferase